MDLKFHFTDVMIRVKAGEIGQIELYFVVKKCKMD